MCFRFLFGKENNCGRADYFFVSKNSGFLEIMSIFGHLLVYLLNLHKTMFRVGANT